MTSNIPDYAAGDFVFAPIGWQEYALSTGEGVRKAGRVASPAVIRALGVLGMPGLTAYT